jgi:DNA (cytosine-5)-methyltransferase 1
MKVLSLFSGVGGFDMGLENAGMETVFQCEWDKHANSILHRHWPDVPKWDDVSTLTGKDILANAPVVDVVAWGSPCQDLSVAGKRAGLEGGRSGLFHEGIRIIKELQEETNGQYPRISIWENVVGALNSNGGADFGIILNEMAEAGALAIEWAVLDAQYFGIPQRRRRVFVIAIFDPVLANRSPSPLLPVAESLPGHLAKSKPKRQSAARTLTEGLGTDDAIVNAIGASIYHKSTVVNQDVNSGHLVTEYQPILIDRAAFNQGENALYQPHISDDPISPSLVAQGPHAVAVSEPVLFDNSRRDAARIAHDGISHTLQTHMGTGGGNVPMLAFDTQFGSNANVTEDVAPTLKSSQQSPSVAYSIREDAKANNFSATELDHANSLSALRPSPQSHHAQMFIAEPTMAVRRLTPLECERLMGWPDNHTLTKADGTTQADTHRYKQCGNGVASPVAQWIAKHLLNI